MPSPEPLLSALLARNLIASQPPPQLLPRGNHNRRAAVTTVWRAATPAGQDIKLTLGPALGDLAARLAAFAAAVPALSATPVFYVTLPEAEALAEAFIPGQPLETASTLPAFPPEQLATAFTQVCNVLTATTLPSTTTACDKEWAAWCARLLSLRGWTEAERTILEDHLLPRLHQQLTVNPPVTRWSNGDFTSANLLVTSSGAMRLIDAEFAARTHFFAEDAVRFHIMSAIARRAPHLFTPALPDPGMSWHLYFWLRQWQLEQENNTPAYLEAVRTIRLGVIRRLAEALFAKPLTHWSAPSRVVEFHLEGAHWLPTTGAALRLNGWCHVPDAELRAVTATTETRLVEVPPSPRPDVQAHYSGDPRALASGFTIDLPPLDPHVPLILSALTGDGTWLPFHALIPGDLPGRGPVLGDYHAWLARQETALTSSPPPGPRFSILLPLYNTPTQLLRACIESVRRQTYPNWELCVVDDGSATPDPARLVRAFTHDDPRIRLTVRENNGGIARATNDALRQAGGDYIVLLDHDDLLHPAALAEFARTLIQDPRLDVIYTDEDKLTPAGRRDAPAFKPEFSPELLRGVMYVGHALCVRRSLAKEAGEFDPAYDGIQDYEFLLRITELTQRIRHLPQILYHWRQTPGSIALHGDGKGPLDEKQAHAVQAHLNRIGQRRQAIAQGAHRVALLPEASALPTVSLIYAPAGSSMSFPSVRLEHDGMITPGELLAGENWPSLAARATGEVIVVLTTAPVALSRGWLARLADVANLPDSGLAAPVLLTNEGRVLESGWTAGQGRLAPLMRGFAVPGDGYNGSLVCNREVSAVSSHAFAFSRRHLAALPPDGDVLAWSLLLRSSGWRHRVVASATVQTPHSWRWAGDEARRSSVNLTAAVRPLCVGADPYFHPVFDPMCGDYRLKFPPPPC